jgi:hypothetical protein
VLKKKKKERLSVGIGSKNKKSFSSRSSACDGVRELKEALKR